MIISIQQRPRGARVSISTAIRPGQRMRWKKAGSEADAMYDVQARFAVRSKEAAYAFSQGPFLF